MQLNDEGVKAPRAKPQGGKKELTVPDYFRAVLKKNKKALATFGLGEPFNVIFFIAGGERLRKRKGPAPSTILA